MIAFKVYGLFIKIIFLNFFSKKKEASIVVNSILYAHSYRIPHKINKYKAPIIYWVKSCKLLFSKKIVIYDIVNSKNALYCLNQKHAQTSVNYLNQVKNNNEIFNVCIRDIPNKQLHLIDILFSLLFNSLLCTISFFLSFFSNNRCSSILCLELTETCFLLNQLKKSNTSYVYYFSAFEKDANFIALLLKNNNIYCHKIPSSNPIKNFYKNVIANKFSFTAPFQINEYDKLKKNWIVNDFDVWPNVACQNLKDKTIENNGQPPTNSIGIFTRGIWLRKKRGDNFLGVGEDLAEILMLDYLKEYLCQNSNINKIFILVHPTEKNTETQFIETKQYYTHFFNGLDLIFIDKKINSYDAFHLFDLGIASISSVILERLYCGYKSMLAPIDIKINLYEDENLNHIIALNKTDFFEKLNLFLSTPTINYFKNFNLEDYRLNQIQTL